jgi:tRNA pseudouridine synthase 10
MNILESAKSIIRQNYVCDSCLGRQFGNMLSGYTNAERGRAVRLALAMEYDREPYKAELGNFHGIRFRKSKVVPPAPGKCSVCSDIFRHLERYADLAVAKLKGVELDTFVVGSRLSDELAMKEETIWETAGTKGSEQMKSEINRELGKLIEKRLKKPAEENHPDVSILLDLQAGEVEVKINPLYVSGRYNKLVRGIPQTKWERYKVTVEDIIVKPFMKVTKGNGHAMHAAGREDIDARCLGWRPFVIEINDPKKRRLDLKKLAAEVNRTKKVEVKNLAFADRREVVAVKSMRPDKVYVVVVEFEKPVEGIERVKKVKGLIKQKTPARVLHRRSNKLRVKKVKNIKWKRINTKKYQFEIHTDAGLYVKELVSGDNGRTTPSISEILGNRGKVLTLDVVKIMVK